MTIGIPRALIYWKKPIFWESFFENLGLKVLLSPATNKEIVELGLKAADPETCFSTKVYWGHLIWLDGKCDYLFIPRLKASEEKLEYCPKFFGIPDVAKIIVKTKILTADFDERKEEFEKTLEKLRAKLAKSPKEIKTAFEAASSAARKADEKARESFLKKIKSEKKKIVIVSHPYNLYDEYVNLRIKENLAKLGAETIFIDEIPSGGVEPRDDGGIRMPDFHWEFGKEMMDKIGAALNYEIAGAIEISSFQCGCDAVMKEFVESKFKRNKIPFLYLIIDEQTGEAGFQTRLEAFMDTL